ncbi:MAG: hypothetical protein PHR35_18335, partial [Kiritimatiellae bacterium]|nr:hypothetical protein [Kiritimatiellia bacterium]
ICLINSYPGYAPMMREVDVFTSDDPVAITMQPAAFNQSSTDLLNGLTGVCVNWSGGAYPPSFLNDATNSTLPDGKTHCTAATGTATYAVGNLGDRYLTRVDVWTPPSSTGSDRDVVDVWLSLSSDGVNFTQIAEAGPRFADATQTNRLSFTFRKGVYSNFQYFRLSEGMRTIKYGGWYYEVDVFVERPAETLIVVR